jgi:hypothetical protein
MDAVNGWGLRSSTAAASKIHDHLTLWLKLAASGITSSKDNTMDPESTEYWWPEINASDSTISANPAVIRG